MSPPLVVALAIAGTVRIDLTKEPLGIGTDGKEVFLKDIWPSSEEIETLIKQSLKPEMFQKRYANVLKDNPVWDAIKTDKSEKYLWKEKSTYIRNPPFFEKKEKPLFQEMRPLLLLGDSVTTDHISPAGSIKESSPAGKWLQENGVLKADFNSYGSRRGNHEIMMRGTFANVRIKNLMIPAKPDGARVEGGITLHQPSGQEMSIYDAAMKYIADDVPTMIFAGEEYGTGSSRDWAAKGTQLLGVKAIVANKLQWQYTHTD